MATPTSRTREWRALGAVPPGALTSAWRDVHWATQVPAAFASAAIQARSDDSHANLGWDEEVEGLVTHPAGRVRVGLRLRDLTLLMLDGDGVAAELSLAGRTLNDALAWTSRAAAAVMDAPPPGELRRRSWEMPEDPVGEGAVFEAPPADALDEVARWYANADLVLRGVASATPGASEVRCWPHHFDVATLVTLDTGGGAEEARSIGVGLAPADASVAEPYFYANPWPQPEDPERVPALEVGGEWFREGWFGAVLRGARLLEGDADGQRARLEGFLRSAIAAGRRLLGEGD